MHTEEHAHLAKPGPPVDRDLLGYHDPLEDSNTVVSAQDCTGLIMAPPVDDAQAEAFTDLYTIPEPFAEPEPTMPDGKPQQRSTDKA